MDNRFIRTQMLLGEEGLEKLKNSKVAVFGIGGVGGYVVEALARSGVGKLVLVDNDIVSLSNLNRQIIATEDTIGRHKTEVMKERVLSINPKCQVETYNIFYLPKDAKSVISGEIYDEKNLTYVENYDILDEEIDYIVDAIDTVSGKIQLVLDGKEKGIPVISSMGTGNKLNPTELEVADIYKTSVCPLAKVMRKELRARGVDKLKVVYSKEEPKVCVLDEDEITTLGENTNKRRTPGSVSFVPSIAGLIIASEVIKDLL